MVDKFKLKSCEVGPNYQFIDGLRAVVAMIGFSNIFFNTSIKNCVQKLSQFLGLDGTSKNSFKLTDSGRTSLFLLLKSLDLPADSEVIFQGFTCAVLPNSILQAGLVPVVVDINSQNYNFNLVDLKAKINPKTKVVILQHTFGMTLDEEQIQELIKICNDNQLVLIEDLAHSLGAKVVADGVPIMTGRVGHCAIVSFGRDKIISSTTGGGHFLNLQNQMQYQPNFTKWFNNLNALEIKVLKKMSFVKIFQALNYVILTSLIIRPFYHFGVGKLILIIVKKLKLIPLVYSKKEEKGTRDLDQPSWFSPKLAFILNRQIESLENFNKHRKEIAKVYAKILNQPYNPNWVYLRYPVVFENNQQYQQAVIELKKIGALAGLWYSSVLLPSSFELEKNLGYKLGDLPVAEKISQKLTINLPTNKYVSQKDALKMMITIKNLLSKNLEQG